MNRTLPPGVALLAAAMALVAACSSSPEPTPSPAQATASAHASAAPSATLAPTEPAAVGVELPEVWVSGALAEEGQGYGMRLAATSDPDLFDGHFFRREADGAVTDQHVITLRVLSRDEVEVQWPDGTAQAGSLALEADGSDTDSIDLAPGCLAFLGDRARTADCFLVPESEAAPMPTAKPETLPTQDEAMGYLCSVGVDELENVTEPTSDFFSTAVLQSALATLDLYAGPVDGRYAKAARDAVLQFQRTARITVDGLVGPQTWTALQQAACAVPEDPAQPAG